MLQEYLTRRLGGPTPINHRLEFSAEVRPAKLSRPERSGVIGFGPITGHYAGIPLSQQLLEHRRPARGRNLEYAHFGCPHRSQPAATGVLRPGRLVHVGMKGLHVGSRLLHGRCDRSPHALFELADFAHCQGHA